MSPACLARGRLLVADSAYSMKARSGTQQLRLGANFTQEGSEPARNIGVVESIPNRDSLALLTLPQWFRPQRHCSLRKPLARLQGGSARSRQRHRRWYLLLRCCSCFLFSFCFPSSCCLGWRRNLFVTARHHFPLAQLHVSEKGQGW